MMQSFRGSSFCLWVEATKVASFAYRKENNCNSRLWWKLPYFPEVARCDGVDTS